MLPGLDGVGGPPPAHRPRRYQRDDSRVCRLAGQLQTTPPVSGTSDRVRSSQANAFTSVCWRRARTWIHSTETDFAEEDTNCSRSTPLHRPARRSSARTIGPVIPAPPRRLRAGPAAGIGSRPNPTTSGGPCRHRYRAVRRWYRVAPPRRRGQDEHAIPVGTVPTSAAWQADGMAKTPESTKVSLRQRLLPRADERWPACRTARCATTGHSPTSPVAWPTARGCRCVVCATADGYELGLRDLSCQSRRLHRLHRASHDYTDSIVPSYPSALD